MMPALTETDVQIVDGIHRHIATQPDYFIYTIETNVPSAIDAMIDDHFRILHTWQPEHPLVMLHHFKIQRPFLTPYFRQRLTALTREIHQSNVTVYSALVFPDKWLFHRANLSGLMQLRHVNKSKQCYFMDYDAGLTWLSAQYKENVK